MTRDELLTEIIEDAVREPGTVHQLTAAGLAADRVWVSAGVVVCGVVALGLLVAAGQQSTRALGGTEDEVWERSPRTDLVPGAVDEVVDAYRGAQPIADRAS